MIEGAFKKTSLHDHLQLLQVNVLALTALTRLFIEPMLARNQWSNPECCIYSIFHARAEFGGLCRVESIRFVVQRGVVGGD
jgi:hypothetical protein